MQPGELIEERFKIEALIGRGGMGAVYRAQDLHTGTLVALKELSHQSPSASQRFAREAWLLSQIKHPGIVAHIAHGQTPEGVLYLVMEWLDGVDLAKRISHERLSVEETLLMLERVAEALGFAHQRGIVHRDIKPPNLFLPQSQIEKVKVLDFGIARPGDKDLDMTRTGVIMGTPGYLAPEQASRGAKDLDSRADIFSLGCVAFECLTGWPAFVGGNLMAVLAKILLEDIPRVSTFREDVPAALDDLIARMLSKNPQLRPEDGGSLAREIVGLRSAVDVAQSSRPQMLTEGERRFLSVLLIAGEQSENFAPTLSSEESLQRSDEVRKLVERYEGQSVTLLDGSTLITLTGKGVATDQAQQIARCALALREKLPQAAMALAVGQAELGAVVGEVIESAARLLKVGLNEASALSAPILLDDVSVGLLDARFDIEVTSFGRVLGRERAIAETVRTLLGRPSPCVGRERELANLDSILEECLSDAVARVVLVTAEAGLGKSRLRYEFLLRAAQRIGPSNIWLARGEVMSAGSSFGLLSQLLCQAAEIAGSEPPALRQEKLLLCLSKRLSLAEAKRSAELLGEFVGISSAANQRQDPLVLGEQLRQAFLTFLAACCSDGPVLIVLEDLHWGDLPTVRTIETALRQLSEQPLMVLALARPEVHTLFPSLFVDRGLIELRLPELSRKASERLVRQMLGAKATPENLDGILRRAMGNAFYLEELIRAVAEGSSALPDTLLAMMQSRLEGLSPLARRVLRAGSIFGEVFWRGGVATLLGEGLLASLPELLGELTKRELIERRGAGRFLDEEEYTFRHALLRDAAYTSLTSSDRVLGHRLAGEWLESTGALRSADAIVLAEHFEQGGELVRAVDFYRRAAQQALNGTDFAAVIAYAERGVRCGAAGEALGGLRSLQVGAYVWGGQLREAERYSEEALSLLPFGSVRWYIAFSFVFVASCNLGTYKRYLGNVASLTQLEPSPQQVRGFVISSGGLAMPLYCAGQQKLGEELLAKMERLRQAYADDDDPLLCSWLDWIRSLSAMFSSGAPFLAQQLAAKASIGFEKIFNRSMFTWAQWFSAHARVFLGDAEVVFILRSLLSEAERSGFLLLASVMRCSLIKALVVQGDLEVARAEAEATVAQTNTQQNVQVEGVARELLAYILLLLREPVAAEREARAALRLLAPFPAFCSEGMLAYALLVQGRNDEALEAASAAMTRLQTYGIPWNGEALVRLVWAEALAASGKTTEAREAISAASQRLMERAAQISDRRAQKNFLSLVWENHRTLSLAASWAETHES